MGHKVKQSLMSSRIDFFYYAFRNILLVGLPLTIISCLVLSNLSLHSSATSSGTDNLTISIYTACTLSSTVNNEHNSVVDVGTYKTNIGKTTITTLCNDGNGYSVYAIGYSNNEESNNKLINTSYPQYSIDTGLATSGLTSQWAMKLNNIENDPSPTPPVITSSYDDTYGLVPDAWTKVAGRTAGTTDMDEGSSFTTTYAVYASSNQHAGSYVGQVKYLLTHPSTMPVYPIMQDIANWKNIRLPNVGDSVQAIDERDGKKYWVTKLADGNIWMTQNLDFDIVANTALNSNTTDLNVAYDSSTEQYMEYSDGYTESNGVIYWQPASSATTIDFTGTTVSGWQDSNTAPYTANKTDSTETGHNSLGNYYNWTAAIASNNSSSLTQDTLNDISKNPKNSICPKGWRLPTISNQSETTIGSTNEFARLNLLYNNNSTSANTGIISQPLYFTLAGNIDNNASYIPGTSDRSFYWSSTITSSNAQALVLHNNGQVEPISAYDAGKFRGTSIRCVAI